MIDWLKEVGGPNLPSAVLWLAVALAILALVLFIVRIVRSMTFGTFVAGGRNRKTRLAVMDAAPVDSHRRLVLVRRDDVEHLILIGGPTDVVVERDIRLLGAARRPASEHPEGQPRPRPAEAPVQQRPERAAPPRAPQGAPAAPTRPAAPPAAAPRMPPAAAPVQQAAPAPPRAVPTPANVPSTTAANPSQANGPKPAAAPASPPPTPRLKPVETAAPASPSAGKPPRVEISLEDEMNRLLGELSSKK